MRKGGDSGETRKILCGIAFYFPEIPAKSALH